MEIRSHPDALDVSAPGAVGDTERYSPCLTVLRSIYPSLTEAERRVADHVLANPSLVLRSSINSVAAASRVGIGTVARLGAKLGYAGFPDLKIGLAVELLNPNYGKLEPVHAGDNATTVIQKVLQVGAQSLHDTAGLLDPAELDRAARAILGARRVDVYAIGALSAAVGRIAQHRLLLLGVPCALHTQQTDHALAAALMKPGDVAVGLSNSGEAGSVVEALGVAGVGGAITLSVTSAPRSALARVAHLRLLTAFRESWFQADAAASRIAMIGVVDALYAFALLLKHEHRSEATPPATANGPPAAERLDE
jgi:DNA-binding MurR/RpiR family transcriptional regulator